MTSSFHLKGPNMTKKLLVKGLWRMFIFLSYAMLGSWLFQYVEKTPKTYREMSVDMLDELHQTYPALNHSEFTAFVQNAYEAVRMGKKIEWTFLNTSSYVFTILTTIGKAYQILIF